MSDSSDYIFINKYRWPKDELQYTYYTCILSYKLVSSFCKTIFFRCINYNDSVNIKRVNSTPHFHHIVFKFNSQNILEF